MVVHPTKGWKKLIVECETCRETLVIPENVLRQLLGEQLRRLEHCAYNAGSGSSSLSSPTKMSIDIKRMKEGLKDIRNLCVLNKKHFDEFNAFFRSDPYQAFNNIVKNLEQLKDNMSVIVSSVYDMKSIIKAFEKLQREEAEKDVS